MDGQISLFELIDEPKDEEPVLDLIEMCKKAETKSEPTPKKKDNVIQFPKKKPELDKAISFGAYTYEDCVEKMNNEKARFTRPDDDYVMDGVLEMCKVDQDFRNNLMRDSKNYDGFLKYMMECASKGYCYRYGNVGMMDNDMALGLALDYYNGR